MTSHPRDLSSEVIDAIASSKHVCHGIHLPVQSGSNNMLKLMNRHYDINYFINKVNQIIGITTSDVEASRKLSEPTMTNCLRNMDTLKKAYVGKFMAQVILADGVITKTEEQFFYYMKQKLGLPDVD